MSETVKPLIIFREEGSVVDHSFMNLKGFRKSIENDLLWVVHAETGRLLPYSDNAPFLDLKDSGRWYEAKVADSFAQAPVENSIKVVDNCGKPVETVDNSASGNDKTLSGGDSYAGTVLSKLESVIRERHQAMPEGSYTTHLFKSGAEKIRKKTGEEAIELILASERKEMVYESADLIYHLLVLLESEEIALSEVLKELEGRS